MQLGNLRTKSLRQKGIWYNLAYNTRGKIIVSICTNTHYAGPSASMVVEYFSKSKDALGIFHRCCQKPCDSLFHRWPADRLTSVSQGSKERPVNVEKVQCHGCGILVVICCYVYTLIVEWLMTITKLVGDNL